MIVLRVKKDIHFDMSTNTEEVWISSGRFYWACYFYIISVFKVVAFNYDNVNVAVFLLWMPPANLRDVGTGKYNVMDFEKYIVLSVVILYLTRDDLRITIFITSASLSFFLNTICSTIHFPKVPKQHTQNWTLRIFVTQCT